MTRWLPSMLAAAASVLVWASPVAAHPLVDRGLALYDEARFREALQAFDDAERATDLSRDELAVLLATRALVEQALADDPARDVTLAQLAVIAPTYPFGRSAPPEVQARFRQLTDPAPPPPAITPHAARDGASVVVRSDITSGARGLARGVRLMFRDPSGGSEHELFQERVVALTAEAGPPELTVTGIGSDSFEYFVELLGPGGVLLASSGSREAPLALPSVELTDEMLGRSEGASRGPGVGLWIGIGSGVLAIAVTVLVLTQLGSESKAQPTAPMFVGF